MSMKEGKSGSFFVVEDFIHARPLTVHLQRIVLGPVRKQGEHALEESKQHTTHFSTTCHLVDEIRVVLKLKGKHEKLMTCSGFMDKDDMTLEPLNNIGHDLSGLWNISFISLEKKN